VSAGYLDAAGVGAEVTEVADEASAALALIRGDADVAVLPTPLFLAVHLGTSGLAPAPHPLATFQVALTNGSTLVVREGSGIEFSRQFAGKTVGIATPWSMPKLLTDIYLLQSGLTPGEDTRWEVLPRGEMGEALSSGRVDALAVEEWLPTELVRQGTARVMVQLHRLWQDHPAEVVAVSSRTAAERGEFVGRLAGALVRGAKDLEGAPPAGATAVAREAHGASVAGHYPFPFHSAVRIILEELKKRGLTPLNVDFQEVAKTACLTALCRERMRDAGFRDIPPEDSRDERMIGCCYTF
jgi:ABC-type nitrate/sulfonate/bicarbonate transport system substrate-binding protein